MSLTVKPAATVVVHNAAGQVVAPGSTVALKAKLTVAGSGFEPGELVSVAVHSTTIALASVTADGTGTVVTTVTVPATLLPGAHTITLSSASNAVVFAFAVAAPPTGSGSGTGGDSANGLPHTGGDSFPVGLLALALIGVGSAVVLAARRGLALARA